MKKSLILAGMLSIGYAYAQEGRVGINTDAPSATLEVKPSVENAKETATTNEGIIAPRLSKVRVANIATPTQGTMVYVLDENTTENPNALISAYTGSDTKVVKITEKGYYFYNGTEWVRVQYQDSANAEWVYDDATKRINLKRSGQPTGFTNKVYYDVQTGRSINIEDRFIPSAKPYNLIQRSTKNMEGVNGSGGILDKVLTYGKLNVNEESATRIMFSGNAQEVEILESNQSPVYWGTGMGSHVNKKNNTTDDYLMGGSFSAGVDKGNVSGYATAGRLETLINTADAYTGEAAALISILSTGAKTTSMQSMKNIVVNTGFGNTGELNVAKEIIGVQVGYGTGNDNIKTPSLIGYYYNGVNTGTVAGVEKHYGIYLNNVQGAQNNYAVYTNAGKVRVGDLANASATADRVVTVDKDGVLKTTEATASKVASTTSVECKEETRGTMNFGRVSIGGKDTDAIGFCMKNGDNQFRWYYIYGGASHTVGTNANFGQGL